MSHKILLIVGRTNEREPAGAESEYTRRMQTGGKNSVNTA
jgi:hypothetical protein